MVKISIIVIAHNEEKILPLCLDSLMNLDFPKDQLEVIIVDNNSTEGIKDIIKRYPVKYVFEPKRSRGAARNRGIRESSGEFIAFTDADCIVDKNWIKSLIGGADSDDIAGCGGKVLSYQPKTWVEEYVDFSDWYSQKNAVSGKIERPPSILTSNAIYRRDVLNEVGLFEEKFIRAEDIDLSWKVLLKGYRFRYVPEAIIWHNRRNNLWRFYKRVFESNYWSYCLFKKYKGIFKSGVSIDWTKSIFRAFITIFSPKLSSKKETMFYLLKNLHNLAILSGLSYAYLKNLGIKISKISFPVQEIIWWQRGDGIEILKLKDGSYYHLDEVGARIWKLLYEQKKIEEIMDIIGEEYEIEKEELKRDIIDLINVFKRAGLI